MRKLANDYTLVGSRIVVLADAKSECAGVTAEIKKAHSKEADEAEKVIAVQDMKVNKTITEFLEARNTQILQGCQPNKLPHVLGGYKPVWSKLGVTGGKPPKDIMTQSSFSS